MVVSAHQKNMLLKRFSPCYPSSLRNHSRRKRASYWWEVLPRLSLWVFSPLSQNGISFWIIGIIKIQFEVDGQTDSVSSVATGSTTSQITCFQISSFPLPLTAIVENESQSMCTYSTCM
eukprot:TRINITY_DN35248_c1_g1_i1.p1 TRINITY_DN35248_c1_g1~~TRINITY_DN35248_c1_g1_i1.p1  ORF type:complete len:119 (-),score=5.08 TRINITY_DN35248_c1_g1_i1:547-903(-)